MKLVRRQLALIFIALLSGATSAQHVLSLDGSRTTDGTYGNGGFFLTSYAMSGATQVLTGAGMTVSTTDRFLAANMDGANVLFTGLPDAPYSAQELLDVASFVAGGGGLVMIRDYGWWGADNDALASVFGVTYNSAISGGGGRLRQST